MPNDRQVTECQIIQRVLFGPRTTDAHQLIARYGLANATIVTHCSFNLLLLIYLLKNVTFVRYSHQSSHHTWIPGKGLQFWCKMGGLTSM